MTFEARLADLERKIGEWEAPQQFRRSNFTAEDKEWCQKAWNTLSEVHSGLTEGVEKTAVAQAMEPLNALLTGHEVMTVVERIEKLEQQVVDLSGVRG
jgi:hypothetical protein